MKTTQKNGRAICSCGSQRIKMQSFTKILFERAHMEFHKNSVLSLILFGKNVYICIYVWPENNILLVLD